MAIMAVSLDGQLWAFSPLVAKRLQIMCLTDVYVVHIVPSLQIVIIENGCEGYSANITIQTKSELAVSFDTSA